MKPGGYVHEEEATEILLIANRAGLKGSIEGWFVILYLNPYTSEEDLAELKTYALMTNRRIYRTTHHLEIYLDA